MTIDSSWTGSPIVHDTIAFEDLSNREFLTRHARPGRIGLSTGITLADRAIARAERHLNPDGAWGCWSHAFIFQGVRVDGHQWVIESDLSFHQKHLQLGVQENRLEKFYDEKLFTTLAVLDFGLSEEQTNRLVREGLDLVATRGRYSLRELLGTLLALKNPSLRGKENLLARDQSFFCSAFVVHLFRRVRVDLAPGLDSKHVTPEDLSRSDVPHTTFLLKREVPASRLAKVANKVKHRLEARARLVRRAVKTLKRR
jgi:hypothetical protein